MRYGRVVVAAGGPGRDLRRPRLPLSSVAAPVGAASRDGDGWEINGQVAFASGTPYSTYYMGQALLPSDEPDAAPPLLLFVAPRSEWEMLDDWGDMLGLRGSGSTASASTTRGSRRAGPSRAT